MDLAQTRKSHNLLEIIYRVHLVLTDVSRGWFVVFVELFDSATAALLPAKTRFAKDKVVSD